MKGWRWRRRPCPSPDAEHAQREALRARRDAENFAQRVDDVTVRLAETHRRNHIAESVEMAIRPRRHPA